MKNETAGPLKILVTSDVHGRVSGLRWILKNERDADALFFLGDGLRDLDAALTLEGAPFPIYRVSGNCDAGCPDPSEGLAPIGGVLFFYTHGHHYNVKWDTDQLADAAIARGADVALYGHTHRRALENAPLDTLPTLFNPGSVRDDGSYGVVLVENGTCSFSWKRVGR